MNRSVLVVDDEPLMRWAIYEGLKDHFAVITAESFEHARLLLGEMQIDVLVTDIVLPDGNGVDLAERLRKSDPAAKIFIMTGAGTADDMDRAFRLDVDGYLAKPFEVSYLRRLLEDRLSRRPGAA